MPKIVRPPGEVRFLDAGLMVWEEPNIKGGVTQEYERQFRKDILDGVVRLLRQRGWTVHGDRRVEQHYRCLRKSYRQCTHRSGLQCQLHQGGRTLEIQFYQNVKRPKGSNPNGGLYDFGKLVSMPYLLRLRTLLEMDHIAGWLVFNCEYGYKLRERRCHAGLGGVDVDAYLEQDAKSRHWSGYKRAIHWDGRISGCNTKCLDGIVKNGDRVFFRDSYGSHRWGVGIAEHNINNMWWVKIGTHEVRNIASHDLTHAVPKEGLRGRIMWEHRRKERLERLMLKAAAEQRYLDAERMRRALEGGLYK